MEISEEKNFSMFETNLRSAFIEFHYFYNNFFISLFVLITGKIAAHWFPFWAEKTGWRRVSIQFDAVNIDLYLLTALFQAAQANFNYHWEMYSERRRKSFQVNFVGFCIKRRHWNGKYTLKWLQFKRMKLHKVKKKT